MTWVRIDEGFPEHPKVLAAGDEAAWLFVCALAYCNRHLTDGFLPTAAVNRLTNHKRPSSLVTKLVGVGLLERADEGFVVHDFLHYQPSKASIDGERAAARERMANARRSSKDVRPNIGRSAPNPTRPDPTRPLGYISDNDDSANTPESSSSINQIIETAAKAIALKDRERPGRGFINGIVKNLRVEQTTTANDCITAGLSLRESAIRVGGDPWYVDKALNGSTP